MSKESKKGVLQVGDFLQYCEFQSQVLEIDNIGFKLNDNSFYFWGGLFDRFSNIIKKKKKRRIG